MHKLESHIRDQWNQIRDKHIYCAVSGGLDSIVLLTLLKTLNFRVSAIHINYQLRGVESEEDAQFVKAYCDSIDVPIEIRKSELCSLLENGGNLQELARNDRYNWFNEILNYEDNYVALAHHANDQIETFFLNISRNAGIMGLSSMPSVRSRIIRPLLDISRSEILDYAQEHEVSWREDSSNKTNKYNRNKLRNVIIPAMNSIVPTIEDDLLFLISKFQDTQRKLENEIKPIYNDIRSTGTISLQYYRTLDEFQKIELIRQLGLPFTSLTEIDKLLIAQKGKRHLIENDNYQAIIREKDHLSFASIHLDMSKMLVTEIVDVYPSKFTKEEIYLDQNLVRGELKVRPWKIGDRMKPIGLMGSKLISDIITDSKIKSQNRENVLVVHDEAEIHWCVGLKVGRTAIASQQSAQIVKCTIC